MSATAKARPRRRPPTLPRRPKTFTWPDPLKDSIDLPMLSDSQVIRLPTGERKALKLPPAPRRRFSVLTLFLSSALAAFLAVVGLSLLPPMALATGVDWLRASIQRPASPAPESTPPAYTVRAGDSLSLIAARQLGDAKRWPEIYALNRDRMRSATQIEVGTALRMPGG